MGELSMRRCEKLRERESMTVADMSGYKRRTSTR